MVLGVITEINPTALVRGNVWHQLVHRSKGRVVLGRVVPVVVLSVESVLAVGARCTDVRTRKRIISGQGMLCIPYVE